MRPGVLCKLYKQNTAAFLPVIVSATLAMRHLLGDLMTEPIIYLLYSSSFQNNFQTYDLFHTNASNHVVIVTTLELSCHVRLKKILFLTPKGFHIVTNFKNNNKTCSLLIIF